MPRTSSGGSRHLVLRGLMVLATSTLVAACTMPFARLGDVTVGDRVASQDELGRVQVLRGGQVMATRANMPIQAGDTLRTAAGTRAVLEISGGHQVFLEEETELEILNPSLLLRVGKAFVQSVRGAAESAREALRVNTEYVVAAPTGTAFLIEVDPDQTVRYVVTEGRVRIAWRARTDTAQAPWPSVVYSAGEGGIVRARQPPESNLRFTPEQIESELAWVRRIEAVTTALVPTLRGSSLAETRALLERTGLRLGRVTRQLQEGAVDERVLSQSISAERRVQRGTAVEVVVSVPAVRVPDATGRSRREAEALLRGAGLVTGGVTEEKVRGSAAGNVLRTDPTRRTLIATGARVALVLTAACTVPDLSGLTAEAAVARLTAEQLTAGRVTRLEHGNTVSSQQPAANDRVTCGSAVSYVVGVIGVD